MQFSLSKKREKSSGELEPVMDNKSSADPYKSASISAGMALPFLRACNKELKDRTLNSPLLFLPFRPGSSSHSIESLIRGHLALEAPSGAKLAADLKLLETLEVMSAVRWIYSRVQGGLLSTNHYELFDKFEADFGRDRNAYDELISALFTDDDKKTIYYEYMDLLTMMAACESRNGHSAIKLAKIAAPFCFHHSRPEHKDFNHSYKSWASAGLAFQHLFLGYLRAMMGKTRVGVCQLPASLHALIANETYPPLRTKSTNLRQALKIKLNVETISSSPLELLTRAISHAERIDDAILQSVANVEQHFGISEECHRIIKAIELVNSMQVERMASDASDARWLDFEYHGFEIAQCSKASRHKHRHSDKKQVLRRERPKTPDWSKFMRAGFVPYGEPDITPILPMHLHLPQIDHGPLPLPLNRPQETGSLAEVNCMRVDGTIWDAWLMSLAGEVSDRMKGTFGRCVIVESAESLDLIIIEEILKPESTRTIQDHHDSAKHFLSFLQKRKNTKKRCDEEVLSLADLAVQQDLKMVEARMKQLLSSRNAPNDLIHDPPSSQRSAIGAACSGYKIDPDVAMTWARAYDELITMSKHVDTHRWTRDSEAASMQMSISEQCFVSEPSTDHNETTSCCTKSTADQDWSEALIHDNEGERKHSWLTKYEKRCVGNLFRPFRIFKRSRAVLAKPDMFTKDKRGCANSKERARIGRGHEQPKLAISTPVLRGTNMGDRSHMVKLGSETTNVTKTGAPSHSQILSCSSLPSSNCSTIVWQEALANNR